jgi:hypothetical protein
MKASILVLFLVAGTAFADSPLCSQLSDKFCADLWSEKNLGNMKTPFGEIASGKSKKSDMSLVAKMDIEALIRAFPRFPEPLRNNKRYAGIVHAIEKHMKSENPSKLWEKQLDIYFDELSNVFDLILHEEFTKKYPHLKGKSESKYKPLDWYHFVRLQDDLRNVIVREKIENTPYWKRIEKIFRTVKEKTLIVIDQTRLDEEQKETLRSRIAAIELSLPFMDKELLGADRGCSKRGPGAFYNYFLKKITVCAGYFYGFQSEAALTHLLAHEFSHALDLSQTAINHFPETPYGKAQVEILSYEGPIKSCKEWNSFMKSGIWKIPSTITPNDHGPYREFKKCLVKKDNLKPINHDTLLNAVRHMIGNYISHLATDKVFSLLSTPQVYEDGKLIENFFFLRPDWKAMRDNYYSHAFRNSDGAPAPHFFVYSLLCEEGSDTPRDFTKLDDEKRKEVFGHAIEKAKLLSEGHLMRVLENCGDECHSLVSFDLARPSAENFADWVASKVTSLVMHDLKPELRKDFVSEVGALFCDRPEGAFDPVLMSEEKKFSKEPHAEHRVRRWNMITTEMAEEAGCVLKKDQGYGACKL